MLQTKLRHLLRKEDIASALKENENVMVCCGRMGPMCIPVYTAMMDLEKRYKHVAFFDMEFDSPESEFIRTLPECSDFRGLPFTVYFRKGKVVAATTSIQTRNQIETILKREFEK